MVRGVLVFAVCVIFKGASTQTIDDITTPPTTVQTTCYNSQWDELLPTLKIIKSSPNIKKDRLLNVVKMIKYLLTDEIDKKQCDKILEDINKTNEIQTSQMDNFEKIVEERMKPIDEAIDRKICVPNDTVSQNEIPKNNTEEMNKVLAKISTALAKLKEQNEKPESATPNPNKNVRQNLNPPLFESLGRFGVLTHEEPKNSITREIKFSIPCQKAVDILEETSSFPMPRGSYCDLPKNLNLDYILKHPKLNSENLPFQTVPNSVTCVESDDTVGILFKPKNISMMQVFGNLLKKITITVLVPYHVSKMEI